MKFMKKETEEVIEEICKTKKAREYVCKNLLLLWFSSTFLIIYGTFFFFKDVTDWERIFCGVCLIIYSLWCCIESMVGLMKASSISSRDQMSENDEDK